MNAPFDKYQVVWAWKLHIDTGEHIVALPSKFVEEDGRTIEFRFFKVEGKKRPAIVWNSGANGTKLIMLTTEGSQEGSYRVTKLGDVLNEGKTSRFDPDKRTWKKYPNRLIESVVGPLSDELKEQLLLEINAFEMTG